MTGFASKWLTWAPAETSTGGTAKTAKSHPVSLETPRGPTDKTDKGASVSFVRAALDRLQHRLYMLRRQLGELYTSEYWRNMEANVLFVTNVGSRSNLGFS